jgi:hypothetical protein
MDAIGVYRSERGTIWRILENDEGSLRVETLAGDSWVPGRIAMVGLRLAATTTRLSPAAVRALPS